MLNRRRFIIILSIIILLVVGWKMFFPSDKDQIKKNLTQISLLLTKQKSESLLSVAGKIKKSLQYFSAPLELSVDLGEELQHTVTIEDQQMIKDYITKAKFSYPWVHVSINNVSISLQEDAAWSKQDIRLEFEGQDKQPMYDAYQADIAWKKISSDWKITELTVKRSQ